MKLYEQQPLGLYLGRVEKADSHIVLLEHGVIEYAHTIKDRPMTIEEQRLLISQLDQAPQPNAAAQKIYNETSINPTFNPNHMVANRAVGSTTRFNRLPATQKEV